MRFDKAHTHTGSPHPQAPGFAIFRIGLVVLMAALIAGCGGGLRKLYRGEGLSNDQVAIIRSGQHTILIAVDGQPVGEQLPIDTREELERRSDSLPGERIRVLAGEREVEVGYVGWDEVPDTTIMLDIGGTEYRYSRQSPNKTQFRYFRSSNKRTFKLTFEGGKEYILKSDLVKADLPPLPEAYFETEADPLVAFEKARAADLTINAPILLIVDWETYPVEWIEPPKRPDRLKYIDQ